MGWVAMFVFSNLRAAGAATNSRNAGTVSPARRQGLAGAARRRHSEMAMDQETRA